MTWRTYDEWRQEGFGVKKGEKSILRDPNRTALFEESQVVRLTNAKSPVLSDCRRGRGPEGMWNPNEELGDDPLGLGYDSGSALNE